MATGEGAGRPARPGEWLALAAMVLGYAALLTWLSVLRHEQFRSGAYDLGIFDQALWLISRGEVPWIEFRGLHILGDHAAVVLYLLSPLYWIWPDARLLLATQSLILASGAVPMYLLARGGGRGPALAWAGAYLLCPALSNMNLYHFHPECIAVPALLWSGYAAAADRLRWYLATCALAISCKAIIALPVAIWGGILCWRHRRLAYGMLALASLLWLIVTTRYLIPALAGGPQAALERYAHWGEGYGGLAAGIVTRPMEVARVLWWRVDYAVALLLPTGFLPLLAPAELLPALPIFLLNALSGRSLQHTVYLHYNAAILPFLWLAALAAFDRLCRRHSAPPRGLAGLVLATSALAFYAYGWNGQFADVWRQLLGPAPPAHAAAARRALSLVPPGASVLADNRMLLHLTRRPRLRMAADHLFPTVLDDDYVVLQVDPLLGQHLLSYPVERQLADFCGRSPAFIQLLAEGNVYVFRRRHDRPAPVFMYALLDRPPPGPVDY